ncbi:MAG: acyl-ACP thioesterase, partial [Lactobacillus iners]|nr:acyl-ACP thioesterase [Lactobacillus iners]
MEKLEKKYTIKSHDCDESGRLKMSILISYMMDTMSHLLDPCIKIEHAGW